jgi:uncharacterized membrane protein YbhN (UPF0104 family)
MKKIKGFLRWLILGATLFFIINTFQNNWQQVIEIRINSQGWLMLFLALISTMFAHIFSGLVWHKILNILHCSLSGFKALKVYLITNIAKYLPGNVWHFYGRINAVTKGGDHISVATLSVLLEPLLMAAAALLVALISSSFGIIETAPTWKILAVQIIGLTVVLIGIHPRIINPVLQKVSKSKGEQKSAILKEYPLWPLLGELGFLLLRGTGFLFVCLALISVDLKTIPLLLTVFSLAWLLGLIVPGAPGGMGIFEATAIASLDASQFPAAMVLTIVALFRIISILAELITALICWLSNLQNPEL